jgi:hypothetical protein
MALPWALLSYLTLFTGCQQGTHSSAVVAVDSSAQLANDSRSRLILALNEVRRLVASKDSQRIARMFRFPFPDSTIRIYGDSVFEGEKARNGGNVSKALFLSGYGEFVQQLQFDQFQEVYLRLDINKLKVTDSLEFKETGKDKACLRGYSLLIQEDSLIEIQAYQNSNEGYSGQGREDSQCEEYLLTWYFVFDGRRLYMIDHSEAD